MGVSCLQFRVILVNGSAVYHQVRSLNVGCVMSQRDLHAHGALGLGDLGLFHITAGHGIALGMQLSLIHI